MTETVEVTLFGYELDIVARIPITGPLPNVIRRPYMRKFPVMEYIEEGCPITVPTGHIRCAVFRHAGGGIYRRVQ